MLPSAVEQLTSLARAAEETTALVRNIASDDAQPAESGEASSARPSAAAAAAASAAAAAAPHAAVVASREPMTSPDGPMALWLRVAIVTIGRSSQADYLIRTLSALLHALPASRSSLLHGRVQLVVVNNQEPPEAHSVCRQAMDQFAGQVTFVTKLPPPAALRCGALRADSKVKAKVWQQTCDLVKALEALLALPPAENVLLMEDDWLLCPNGLTALAYLIDKATRYDSNWMALRASYGFNGVVVRHADLHTLQAPAARAFGRLTP